MNRLALESLIEMEGSSRWRMCGCVIEQRVEDAAVTAKWKGHCDAIALRRSEQFRAQLGISPLTTLIIDHPTH
jgi:hypothetical protein